MKKQSFCLLEPNLAKVVNQFSYGGFVEERGVITYVSASVLEAKGIHNSFIGEVIKINEDARAYVFGFRGESIQLILLNSCSKVRVGDAIYRTGELLSVPVGRTMMGRIVDPIGVAIDGKGPIQTNEYRLVENVAPSVMQRVPVDEPMHTGIKVIDSMIPIGKGQRELIVGDRQSGKSAVLIDTILNQVKSDVICIYVAIAQRASTVASIISELGAKNSLEHVIFVVSLAEDPPSLRYLAPFSGAAIAEYFAAQGKDVLIVYDDLSKHADSYRELSLLLQRPPAREAYPSDIFYLHSRLLERAGHFCEEIGGGSITALPVVETYGGDISQYIPTNLISITDGQIYIEKDLFNAGIRPAVNVGLSVSRVGSAAQTKAMRKVSKSLRLDLSQYFDLKTFTEFGSELDKETAKRLKRGEILVELLKQKNNHPLSLELQVVLLHAYNQHVLDTIPLALIGQFEADITAYIERERPQLLKNIEITGELSEDASSAILRRLLEYREIFLNQNSGNL
jgi:F-type H+-transporting ATPase subunit alpha